jgi:Fe-S-cluster-containing dehydrogenase component/formate-dependent nitrite reductase membrane component NrfD
VRYGFVLDQNRCIGCHACTVACKEENGVALGVFRTWVKYVEKGTFPDTRRHFAVLRCNHCDDAPCITICPTGALFRRKNGIVDFDNQACIGCKACMQACPYDAIHIDPQTNTAAKCHFCAHRVEQNLEPACVIVCPEQAIVTGDLDDPASRIAKLVAREEVRVRKPEQGTNPKVFYLGADESTLTPGAAAVSKHQMSATPGAEAAEWARQQSIAALGDNPVLQMARVAYDPDRNRAPWGWKVAAYLWTKSVAAGALGMAAVAAVMDRHSANFSRVSAATALIFMALTSLLLVLDLKKPSRFLFILLRPNWRSWLVIGTWILMGFSGVALAWLFPQLIEDRNPRILLAMVSLLAALAAACYSAFLFGQAEGRDFWQSPLLFFQLFFAAVLAGAAVLSLAAPVAGFPAGIRSMLRGALVIGIAGHMMVVLAEVLVRHPSQDAARAARLLSRGSLRTEFWAGVFTLGSCVALAAVLVDRPLFSLAGPVLALLGLGIWEHLWVKAGQEPPLS